MLRINSFRKSDSLRLKKPINSFVMKTEILVFIFLSVGIAAQANPPEKDSLVRASIDQLFDGMRKGDSTMVRTVMHPEMTLKTCYVAKTGETKIANEQLIDFLNAVGTPHTELWDERIHDVEIKIDDRLAMAWVPYEFYVDDKYSHEGVNVFELVEINGKWLILSITDTRRRKN